MRTENLKPGLEVLANLLALFVIVFLTPCACVAIQSGLDLLMGR